LGIAQLDKGVLKTGGDAPWSQVRNSKFFDQPVFKGQK
jgi:hypothetical protein